MAKQSLIQKIGKEELYLINDFEDMAFRITPDPVAYFAKIKGKNEFETKSESKVLTDALIEQKEITKAEYEAY